MSEDRKKHLRTQGKYEPGKSKGRDKKQKSSPGATEMKTHKRYSNESKGSDHSFTDDSISPVKYQENSDHSFEQLEEQKKAIEIKESGKCTLSTTHNGESVVVYEPKLLLEEEADDFYDRLYSSISWYSKNIVINGEEYPQPRLVAWFGPYPYSYSGATLEPQDMPDSVLEIKTKVEDYLNKIGLNVEFNSVLLNLYRNGKDSVAWHSDDESTMGIRPTIASVSLGETRRFEMRPKRRYSEDENPTEKLPQYFVNLTHGSLIIMDGCMQDDWQHRVPKEYHDRYPRINLTFRTVYPFDKPSHREPRREIKNEQADVWVINKTSSSKIKFSDDDFPPLGSSDVIPSSSHPSSGVKNDSLNSSSDSSSRNDNLDNSCEIWDTEKVKVENDMPSSSYENWDRVENDMPGLNRSYENSEVGKVKVENDKPDLNRPYKSWDIENVKVENDMPNNGHTHNYFEIINVKYPVKIMDGNENSFEMNLAESHSKNLMQPSDITEEHVDNKPPSKTWLNVSAKEFVPKNTPTLPYRVPEYSKFPLEELLHYELELMSDEGLVDFSYALKEKVLERVNEFQRSTREELEFLCLLTDGTQSEKNQKLISSRIINIASNSLKRPQRYGSFQGSYNRHPRAHSYGNQNNTDVGRRSFVNRRGANYRQM